MKSKSQQKSRQNGDKKQNRHKNSFQKSHNGHRNDPNKSRVQRLNGASNNRPSFLPKKNTTKPQTIIGFISTTAKGAGYIDDADPKLESTYIEPGFLNTALNGDTVEVLVHKDSHAEVVNVLKRARDTFVGKVSLEEDSFILIPDDRKMYTTLMISGDHKAGGTVDILKPDQKALVRMLSWNDPEKKPRCEIIKILGTKGDNEVEMESIVLESGFETKFPEAVEMDAERVEREEKKITPEEVAKRRDIRNVLTFTIDPYDAKDFDDAISFRKLSIEEAAKIVSIRFQRNTENSRDFENSKGAVVSNNQINAANDHSSNSNRPGSDSNRSSSLYEIGVHIADVSHYVREGNALDQEALKRGCSVYLVDRTIPMLPEVLSNDVCSLNPHEDKLTFSAIFIMNDRAQVISRWFGRTVMNSDHRFTYETAQAAIDGKAENVVKYSNRIQTAASAELGLKYRDELTILNKLAKILARDKFSKGAIEFEQEEVKFQLDPKGKPLGVYKKERLDTHKLVEEYMLLANREVAKFISDSIKNKGGKDFGAIYRIHDAPDKEKMKNLSFFVKALGYDLKTADGVVTARSINDLLEQIENTPHEGLIRTAAIRSMQKAVYSTRNIGHFGLAFDFYTHFTSPIRRYPDLLVHRILAKHLSGGSFSDNAIASFQTIAESCTNREIDAAQAERASVKFKQVEFMSTKIGQTFDGVISGVTKWGIYVEDKVTKSEGMIHIGELGKDYFNFEEKTYSIVGEKTGLRFTLGDEVSFKVVAADLDKRTLDYALVL